MKVLSKTMNKSYKTISGTACGEIIEKKSRFIANAASVKTQEEAFEFIKSIKKKYWDARHNCSAFVIGGAQSIMHSSDDGEPSGTAGKPMLNVLTGRGLCDLAVVVTRYFGGTLLGTGGLVRAYSAAVEECIKNAVITEQVYCAHLLIESDYSQIGRLQSLFSSGNAAVLSSDYTDKVTFTVIVPAEKESHFIKAVKEATLDAAVVTLIDRSFYEFAT